MRSTLARVMATSGFVALAVLHIGWGRGSSFPFRRRSQLADAVVGRDALPDPVACNAVAACLVVAAGLVADVPVGSPRVRTIGRAGVAAVLTTRGLLGLAGRSDLVSPGSSSPKFRTLDRRYFSPLCFALAGATLLAGGR